LNTRGFKQRHCTGCFAARHAAVSAEPINSQFINHGQLPEKNLTFKLNFPQESTTQPMPTNCTLGLNPCLLLYLIILEIYMFKQNIRVLSVAAALFTLHTAASACVGPECAVNTQVEVKFNSSYYLSPNANGIYTQSNTGNRVANIDIDRLVMRNDGAIDATATSVGNIANITIEAGATVPVRHINQTNVGNQVANVDIWQLGNSMPGEVKLEALALGNSFSYTATGTSLHELSVAQCNVGNGVANVTYNYDPTKLTATATAIGNNITIRGTK
jgi:hypothetical protein